MSNETDEERRNEAFFRSIGRPELAAKPGGRARRSFHAGAEYGEEEGYAKGLHDARKIACAHCRKDLPLSRIVVDDDPHEYFVHPAGPDTRYNCGAAGISRKLFLMNELEAYLTWL